jgi:hypothetical protein
LEKVILKKVVQLVCVFTALVTFATAKVSITSPQPGSSTASPVHFVATATSDYGNSTASIILYIDGVNRYTTYSSKLDTTLSLSSGWRQVIFKSWDSKGNISQAGPYGVYVSGGTTSSSGTSNITVTSPVAGSTVTSPTRFLVSAKSSTTSPISSILIYVDDVKKYTTYSSTADTTLSLSTGTRKISIKSWDGTGREYRYDYTINVGSGSSTPTTTSDGTNFYNVEQMSGWGHCDACAGAGGTGPSASYSMTQGQSSPSLDGNSTRFWLGGSTPYSNALWWKQLVSESQADKNRSLKHFVYDAYFYLENPGAAQSLEWDANQFIDGKSYIMGTQCSYRSAGTWDVWDNIGERWISTGIACPPLQAYKWHHVEVEFERTWDNKLRYVSVSMNGMKHYLNRYYSPRSTSWSGITVNYQMDGNYKQEDYSTWVDKLTLRTW